MVKVHALAQACLFGQFCVKKAGFQAENAFFGLVLVAFRGYILYTTVYSHA